MLLSMLSLFGLVPTFQKAKCKKLLNITMERIKLLKSRQEAQLRQLRMDVAQLLKLQKEQKAQVWLGRIWKELCLLSVYSKIADYCQSLQTNLKDIAGQRECPSNLEEPLAGLCFAASCCADLPELQELREIFAMKYGKHFVTSAQGLQPECHVNPEFLEFFRAKNPSDVLKQDLLKQITSESEMKQGKEEEIYDPSSREVIEDTNESRVQQEEIVKDSDGKDDKDQMGSENKEMDVAHETNHAARVSEEDFHSTELANRKRTLEGRQTRRSALKRRLPWQNKATEEGYASKQQEKMADKVRGSVDEEGQGDKTESDIQARLAVALEDGSLQGEDTNSDMNEYRAPNKDQHIILYVEQPLFSRPPQRLPPPPPPPKRAPPSLPSLKVMSMPASTANTRLPLGCSTMANNHFIESYGGYVHPRLPKYEDLFADFSARKR